MNIPNSKFYPTLALCSSSSLLFNFKSYFTSASDYLFLCCVNASITIRPATENDCGTIHDLIRELAVFEKAPNEVVTTPEQLKEDAFGEKPIVEMWVATRAEEILGAALIFEKYSTWKGRSIHLEDLIVRESERGNGIGTMLFDKVVSLSKERGYGRMEWMVLDWNTKAIDFYEKYGTEFLEGWIDCRLSAEQIRNI